MCSEEPWQAPVSGLASPEFGFRQGAAEKKPQENEVHLRKGSQKKNDESDVHLPQR
jgi:hypothetical protein